jgi:hypothetical protein
MPEGCLDRQLLSRSLASNGFHALYRLRSSGTAMSSRVGENWPGKVCWAFQNKYLLRLRMLCKMSIFEYCRRPPGSTGLDVKNRL